MENEVTTEWLQKELSETEKTLAAIERQRDNDPREGVKTELQSRQQTPLQRLIYLQDTVEYLQLANDITQCQQQQEQKQQKKDAQSDNPLSSLLEQHVSQCEMIGQLLCRHPRPATFPDSNNNNSDNNNNDSHYAKLFGLLWEQEYQPLYAYVKSSIITSLRRLLKRTGYPAVEGCSKLLNSDSNDKPQTTVPSTPVKGGNDSLSKAPVSGEPHHSASSSFISYCQLLTCLQRSHRQVIQHVVLGDASAKPTRAIVDKSYEIMVIELLRPIVERVQYHFVEKPVEKQPKSKSSSSSTQQQQLQPNLTISRLDHLPEWIITYVRDHVLPEGGPWDLIRLIVAPNCVGGTDKHESLGCSSDDNDDPGHVLIHFLNEVVRLIQWVLVERNFFRHPQVAGRHSSPILLCRAVEQLMTFDAQLRDLLPAAGPRRLAPQLHQQNAVLLQLTDILLAHDDELFQWWLEREREFALSTLFEDEPGQAADLATTSSSSTSTVQPLWQLRIAPRAELFCVLIRSIQTKASNFTMPGPYLAHVAVPLCMQFLDAIHESSRDLRHFLSRRKLPEEADLRANLLEWMDLINGTCLSASVLLRGSSGGDHDVTETSSGREFGVDHDLTRLGRSLARLHDALVDEFGLGFVETLLMERARLASYLMQAPHMLSDPGDDMDGAAESTRFPDPSYDDIPAELQTVKSLLDQLVHLCDVVVAQVALAAGDESEPAEATTLAATWEVAKFAAHAMKRNVLNRLAEKFLEIVLDDGMVPEIVERGARKFAWDVRIVFGDEEPLASGQLIGRLMEVATFLSLDHKQLLGLKSAMMGLTTTFPTQQLLDVRQIAADGTIYDEAVSMIRAKGFEYLDLEDVISILNRMRGIVV